MIDPTEFRTKPNPDHPNRCPSIDPHDTLQCMRQIHEDALCQSGGIGWVKGTPRYISDRERVSQLSEQLAQVALSNQAHEKELKWLRELILTMLGKDALEGRCVCGTTYETYEGPEEDCPIHGREYSWWVEATQQLAVKLAEALRGSEVIKPKEVRAFTKEEKIAFRKDWDDRVDRGSSGSSEV